MSKYTYESEIKEINKEIEKTRKKNKVALLTNDAVIDDKNELSNIALSSEWTHLCLESEKYCYGKKTEIEKLFNDNEIRSDEDYFKKLDDEFNQIYKLDKIDLLISVIAGLLSGATDIILVGTPEKTSEGIKAGKLSDIIRNKFDEALPEDKIKELEKMAKVPFDAQDNRNTEEFVEGLSSWYHRQVSLGHDPSIIGFAIGVYDIMHGSMTTIDASGKFASQTMGVYADRKESNIFAAIAKEFLHLASDVNTPQGLPAPLMNFCNLLQFGSIGEEEATISEIVKSMYAEGYDFEHFVAMSIPEIITEVVIRVSYAIKTKKLGLPISLNQEKNPKLVTMLTLGHGISVCANTGKIIFVTKKKDLFAGLMSINYVQWLAFAAYLYKELKWSLHDKKELREKYLNDRVYEDLKDILKCNNNEVLIIEPNNKMNKDKYVKLYKDMKIKSTDEINEAVYVLYEVGSFIENKNRTIDDSLIPDVIRYTKASSVTNNKLTFSELFSLGFDGFSNVTEDADKKLEEIKKITKENIIKLKPLAIINVVYISLGKKAVSLLKNDSKKLKHDKNELYRYTLLKKAELQKTIEDEKDISSKERIEILESLNILLEYLLDDLKYDLGINY